MGSAITAIRGRIKCDANGCDFAEDHEVSRYRELLNKPCPKCGANLLDERQLVSIEATLAMVELFNSTVGQLPESEALVGMELKFSTTPTPSEDAGGG